MNCSELERWLDEGMPEPQEPAARAHAASCRRCAEALRVAFELDAMLEAASVPAPSGFTDRVMARVAHATARANAPVMLPSAFPWWVQAAAQPATALAATVAALVVWKGDTLRALASSLTLSLTQSARAAMDAPPPAFVLPAPFDRPEVILALGMVVLPAAAWFSWVLFRWSERLALISSARVGSKVS